MLQCETWLVVNKGMLQCEMWLVIRKVIAPMQDEVGC